MKRMYDATPKRKQYHQKYREENKDVINKSTVEKTKDKT